MADEMSKDEIREKLLEMTDPERSGIGGLMASLASPLIGALVQVQQAKHVIGHEDQWPPVHKLAMEVELTTAQASMEMARQDLEDLLVETLYLQQHCQCQDCRMQKADMN